MVKDLTNIRFGRLIALKQVDLYISPKGVKTPKWLCKCDCGNETIVLKYNLIYGITKSCGCLHKELAREKNLKDITNQRFGKLVAIKRVEIKKHGSYWLCKCDCGNEKNILIQSLLSGATKSCGCLLKDNERMKKMWNVDGISKIKVGLLTAGIRKNNSSGTRGVFWNKKTKKWEAQITINGNRIYLGAYKNKEDTIKARKEGEEKYFKPIIRKYESLNKSKE